MAVYSTLAAVDLGSNSFHLQVARVVGDQIYPLDSLREPVRIGAHGVVFVHNHPSGDAAASVEDGDLTERLRAASELVGVVARDHVIVATGGYFSFVEAGRWRR